MIGSDIAKRYAKAFFEIAGEENRYEQYYAELKSFSAILSESASLNEFLANPIFDQPEKKAVVVSILQKIDISPMSVNFLGLLVDKRRITILPEIVSYYEKFMDDTLRKVRVGVRTAYPLSAELVAKLQKSMEEMTAKQVEMTIEEDVSLLGGIVVRIGDKLYDNSIQTQLNNIRNLLGEEA